MPQSGADCGFFDLQHLADLLSNLRHIQVAIGQGHRLELIATELAIHLDHHMSLMGFGHKRHFHFVKATKAQILGSNQYSIGNCVRAAGLFQHRPY